MSIHSNMLTNVHYIVYHF